LEALLDSNGEGTDGPASLTFDDFDDFWTINLMSPSVGPNAAAMSTGDAERLKARVQGCLPAEAAGRIICDARANAIKGRLPT
jgi:hypothetical protein